MIIYFIRHGETEWNKKEILQGHKDSPLTLKGKKDVENLGKILEKKKIEVIYTSDLGRCVQTAEIINKRLKIKLVKTKKLRERDYGSLNGKPNKEIRKVLDLSNLDEKAPEGESFNQLKKRVINFLKLLNKEKFKRILVVTHDEALRAILKCNTRPDKVYFLDSLATSLNACHWV